MRQARKVHLTALAAALSASFGAGAVSLNGEGLGQALIYPYYTVRSAEGNAFNSYLSVVNHTSDAKAVRVRVRDGIAAREVASLNLYLSPNDAWTVAIVPSTDGARLITADTSCTDPALAAANGIASLDFRNNAYATDPFGASLDRTREGYVEMIEMATLTGESRAAATHNSAGVPANCAAIRANSPTVAAPTGGLSGTLTLINVNTGMDFTLNAEALADLSARPFFRAASDPYPDFAASEIDNVSVVVANNQIYRSVWTRGFHAVSAVLMRWTWSGEYVLDTGTASQTDFVTTLPTRHYHATQFSPGGPFTAPTLWNARCARLGEEIVATFFNREERGANSVALDFPELPPPSPGEHLCAAVAVATIHSGSAVPPVVLGSATRGSFGWLREGFLIVTTGFSNGWIVTRPLLFEGSLTSQASSTRIDLATGAVTTGAHVYFGLPILGFAVRTFRNGTLACTSGACQGNYGGAFPFKYTRRITPP